MLHNAIALVNGKGGVGKTSIAANVAGILANSGWNVLAVDLDRQGNLRKDLGYSLPDEKKGGEDLFQALCHDAELKPSLLDVRPGLDVIPGGPYMESVENTLAGRVLEPRLLALKLAPLAGDYHVIIIDCPPAGGVMTTLAMSAVNGLVVPVKADDASAEGLTVLYKQLRVVRESANPELRLLGVVLFGIETGATALRRSLREELERELGDRGPVFESIIRHSSRAAFDTRRAGELAHEYEIGAAASKGDRLRALRQGGQALKGLRRFSTTASGLAGDYAALAEEIAERLSDTEQVDVPS